MGARIRQVNVIRNFPNDQYFFIEFRERLHAEEFANHFIDWLGSRGEKPVERPGEETIYAGFKRVVEAGRRTFCIHSAENPDYSAMIDSESADREGVNKLFDEYAKVLKKRRELPTSSPSTPR